MKEDLISRFYHLVEHDPASDTFRQFQAEIDKDDELRESWYSFLVEQHLSTRLSSNWVEYLLAKEDSSERIREQRHIQNAIRVLHEKKLKVELSRTIPRVAIDQKKLRSTGQRRTMMITLVSVAAVGILCLVVFLPSLMHKGPVLQDGEPPVIVFEPFELEGVTEEEMVQGIPQRMPSRMSAVDGIYPVTEYAVRNVTERLPDTNVAAALHANYTVRCKVSQDGEDLHYQLTLVDVERNKPMWSDDYDGTPDVVSVNYVQKEMGFGLAKALRVNLSPSEKEFVSRNVSDNEEATKLFLQAERELGARTQVSMDSAIMRFEQALAIDSLSPVIRGYLAFAFRMYADNDYGDSRDVDLAKFHALRTLELDSLNPEALITLGYAAFMTDRDNDEAARYFQRALEIVPGDAKVHQAIAELHLRTGDILTGFAHIEAARKLEPERNTVRWIETKYLTATGQLELAREKADELMRLDSNYIQIKNFYWQYYLMLGDHEKALAEIPDYGTSMTNSEGRENYMKAMVYIDAKDFASCDSLYEILPPGYKQTFDILYAVQRNEWETVRDSIREIMQRTKTLGLLPTMQCTSIPVLEKLKADPIVQQILDEYGIQVNRIRREDEIDM